MSATKAICRVLPICIDSGECPQAPSNRPLQPLKRHGNIKLGQPRKLCLAGGPIPRVIEHSPPRSTFSRSVFSTPSIFEEGRNFAFWGDLRGLCGLVRPHARARLSRDFGPFLVFSLFLMESCLTFVQRHGIVLYSFRTQATCLCQSAGGFAHVSTGFFELTSSLGIERLLIMRQINYKFTNSQSKPSPSI